MGSTSDMAHCEKIKKACSSYGIPCILRVTSAHKGPDETLRIKAEYEGGTCEQQLSAARFSCPVLIFLNVLCTGDCVPTIFVAVAGRSNGLGPVMSGNTAYPVINCPPLTPDWGAQDVWSSLRMPSGEQTLPALCFDISWVKVVHQIHSVSAGSVLSAGLGCSTVLSPEAAAQFAAQIIGLNNHLVWCKLRASILNTWVSLKVADQKLQACSL